MKIFDITKDLLSAEVYPGDPSPNIKCIRSVQSDDYMLTELTMGTHSGTHIDAPCHFINGGATVADIILEKCMGKCVVCDNIVTAEQYIANGFTRIILKGVDITQKTAETFSNNIVLLGTDGMSFGGENAKAVHETLLDKNVVLLESLALESVSCGEYILIALPLKLAGCDGSPVRAVLIDYEK